jgi:phosphoglycerate dehydrogenase-like enzyme
MGALAADRRLAPHPSGRWLRLSCRTGAALPSRNRGQSPHHTNQTTGQPPLVDDTVLRAMRPGAWLVNVARGALLDADAAIAHLNTGHLAGLGLDVFPAEPYPADGPLAAHPRIMATAHTAALTSDYFAAASERLGDALTRYLIHQPPAGLLS